MLKYFKNPIFTTKDVIPTRDDFKVDGIFNCGAIKFNDDYILLCRIAESYKNVDAEVVSVPIVKSKNSIDTIERIDLNKKEYPDYDFSDSRSVWTKEKDNKKIKYLTSLSHFRIAKSKNGEDFVLDTKPTIFPRSEDEEWGIEDPRITFLEGSFYINYTSVTRNGAATSLIITKDFINFERKGVIFAPENKDVTIFPEKINGSYYAFNRPVPYAIGYPDMWICKSNDFIHWGEQKHFYGVSLNDSWEGGRIGGGAVPFLSENGWIKIYHAADKKNRYCLGAFLLDKNDPEKILGKTQLPILEPTEKYEIEGFFGNVVFTCGCIVEGDEVFIYYGAADDKICLAKTKISELLEMIVLK